MNILARRDRDGSFDSIIIPKITKDIYDIDRKVILMYAKGVRQLDISDTIEGIYGFKALYEIISQITNCVLEKLNKL